MKYNIILLFTANGENRDAKSRFIVDRIYIYVYLFSPISVYFWNLDRSDASSLGVPNNNNNK